MKVVVIIGIPGSGKTTLAKRLGGLLVDDASQHEAELKEALCSDAAKVVITDVNAVYSTREKIERSIKRLNPLAMIEFICFENNADHCWANICSRADNRMSLPALIRMAADYHPEWFNCKIIPVYMKEG